MAPPLVLWHGRNLALVPEPPERVAFVRVGGDLPAVALQMLGERSLTVAPGDRSLLTRGGPASLRSPSSLLSAQLMDLGIPCAPATPEEARRAASRLSPPEGEREVSIAVAEAALARAQRDPTETVIALSREEERLERSLGREVNAQEELLAGWGETNPGLAGEVRHFRESFTAHHRAVEKELERKVTELAPTLSAVAGEKVAARLVAAANGLSALARMPAGRLQLLGVRRRPARGPGPRHGIVFRANGMETVPWARRGAYARTLAAIAVIAARADLAHHGSDRTRAALLGRLERRRRDLRRER